MSGPEATPVHYEQTVTLSYHGTECQALRRGIEDESGVSAEEKCIALNAVDAGEVPDVDLLVGRCRLTR